VGLQEIVGCNVWGLKCNVWNMEREIRSKYTSVLCWGPNARCWIVSPSKVQSQTLHFIRDDV